MINLSQFSQAKFQPSKRLTRCRNCDDWSGDVPVRTPIPAGRPRIVVSGGWGPASRNLTLCQGCARAELDRILDLADQLSRALGNAAHADLTRLWRSA